MRFKLFSDAKLRNKSVDALRRRLRSKRAGYHLAFKDIKVGNLLYRGVPLHDWPSKIDEVSYPPADKAKLNRANRAGRSIAASACPLCSMSFARGDRIARES
jgi:hypothetical protein